MSASRDRAAEVRRALLELVSERGFHGTSVAAVAQHAGVAAGTIYVHYPSKDDLVLATFREVKRELGAAALANADRATPPEIRFRSMWRQIYQHLAADPPRARFLMQIESSPYARMLATKGAAPTVEPLDETNDLAAAAMAPDLARLLVDLPPLTLYDLAFGPAIRLAADPAAAKNKKVLTGLVEACWRAITKPVGHEPAASRT